MKILIIQENGRHDQNRNFRECHNFYRSFNRLGHDCTVWGLGHDNFSESFDDLYKKNDVIFILENYEEHNWIPDLSEIKKLKVFWSIDSHCNPIGNVHTSKKHNVDIVLNSIESDQILFENKKTFYFPNAYPSDLIFPNKGYEKKYMIGFCGTPFGEREDLINIIESKTSIEVKKDFWVLGDDMVKSINSYKLHLNKTIKNDINYRVFETLGVNTCLLTNKVENLNNFFVDMEDLVMYETYDELIDKINFLIKNENKINEISNSGYNKVVKNHTYDNRALEFIKIIEKHI
jgi:spore maturation protein CgeB